MIHEAASEDAQTDRRSRRNFWNSNQHATESLVARPVGNSKTKKKNKATSKRLEEHLLSPFETENNSQRDSKNMMMPHLDSFSISGEFNHHMEVENQSLNHVPFEMQTITNLDNISKKFESDQP